MPAHTPEASREYGERCFCMVSGGGMKPCLLLLLALSLVVQARDTGSRETGTKVVYAGGTVPGLPKRSDLRLDLLQDDVLKVSGRRQSFQIRYRDIDTLEYGLQVSRRYVEAALISPVFLVAKKKVHFLTIGYTDQDGNHQAMVLQVGKDEIRPLLVSLEARTGRRVEYQDEEARKAGKG